MEEQEKDEDIAIASFKCDKCDASFSRKDSLKRHYKTIHNEKFEDDVKRTKCLYPGCESNFYHKIKMLEHMQLEHDTNIEVENLNFDSLDSFIKWKEEEEESNHLYFSKQSGTTCTKSSELSYYICQRDGSSKAHRKSGEMSRLTTRKNKKGCVKTDHMCPARIVASKEKNGNQISVKYIQNHNHHVSSKDIQHHPIPQTELEKLKSKLAIGIPPEKIHKDLREGQGCRDSRDISVPIKKMHFVAKRQIREIARKMKVNRRLHPDDATSVYYIVSKLQNEKYNCVLLYKPQNEQVVIGPNLPNDDLFLFACMTKEQEEMLKENASKIVCVDGTHGTNQYAFNLITVLVPDEFGKGYPVAHLISNRQDETVLTYFFQAIKDRIGNISINALMTDDDNAGWNAFCSVFGSAVRHLLCKWHIHRAWGRKLRSFFPGETEIFTEIYQALVMLLEEKNSNNFYTYLESFICKYRLLYPEMIKYMDTYYFNRNEKWAMCFRNFPHGNTDTNMFLESYHNRLKTFFMNRKRNKRVDDLINLILLIEEEDYWRHKKDMLFSGPDDGCATLRHHRSMKIPNHDVNEESEDRWKVTSQSKNGFYIVKKEGDKCSSDHCFSKCLELSCIGLCGHLYTCSCQDTADICKHIHKVHSLNVATSQVITNSTNSTNDNQIFFQPERHVSVSSETKTKDDLAIVNEQLQTIKELTLDKCVQAMLLPHLKGALQQLILQCKAVSSEQNNLPEPMVATESIQPNEKLSFITKMKRTKKISKKDKQPFQNHIKRKKIAEELCCDDSHDYTATLNPNVPEVFIKSDDTTQVFDESEVREREVRASEVREATDVINLEENEGNTDGDDGNGDFLYLVEPILKNGEFSLSQLSIMSIEPSVKSDDLKKLKRADPQFSTGWLYDEVIDSYIWNLQQQYEGVLLIPTAVMKSLEVRGSSIRLLWKGENLKEKQWVLGPWNPTGQHWMLSAYNIKHRTFYYIDPMTNNMGMNNVYMQKCHQIYSVIMQSKLEVHEEIKVNLPPHTLQTDTKSCGVFTCWYAKQLVSGNSLTTGASYNDFRIAIYEEVVGNCLSYTNDKMECPHCNSIDEKEWVECERCGQWHHCSCIGMTAAEADDIYFICPS